MEDPAFEGSPDNFFSTLFHELVHSTGHPNRLDRPVIRKAMRPFASVDLVDYNFEELIAEHGAAFLDEDSGITSMRDDHARYLRKRIYEMQATPQMVAESAKLARDAVDLILGHTSETAATAMRLVA
jgi:antirestriction protein ArdC